MLRVIGFFGYYCVRFLLNLRYRIIFNDPDFALENPRQGTIFLANHVSEVDPVILVSLLWKRFQPRALASKYLFSIPVVSFFLKLTRAFPVPVVLPGGQSEKKLEQIRRYQKSVVDALHSKDNILIYPSGKLSHDGKEEFLEQSAAFLLLESAPKANVVLLRTRGLWGSFFSRALTNATLDLKKGAWQALKVIFRNFIFFVPKREVIIEVFSVPRVLLSDFQDKKSLNTFLASWLNKDGEAEPLNLVPYK
ncbi:MAG: lysophospholipid acyltransferase family protein [Victivallaceae bacterium]